MYKEDNKIVWLHLKAALLKTLAYDHILKSNAISNGRRAWNITILWGCRLHAKTSGRNIHYIKNTVYKGESNKQKFEYYANKCIKVHKLLVGSGYNNDIGLDDATKIQHLKSRIKIEASL